MKGRAEMLAPFFVPSPPPLRESLFRSLSIPVSFGHLREVELGVLHGSHIEPA
jgi:hypothetical protein